MNGLVIRSRQAYRHFGLGGPTARVANGLSILVLLAAEVGVVHLDHAREYVAEFPFGHGITQFMQHMPGGVIADFKLPRQRRGRVSPFVGGA